MMKFFRKYMKHLLAVFMSLLLVVWLGGSALSNLLNQQAMNDDIVRGHAFGEEVRQRDMQPAFDDANILTWIGIRWELVHYHVLAELAGNDMGKLRQYAGQLRQEPISIEEWYMLDAATRQSGIHVSGQAVQRFMQEAGLSGEILAAVRDRHGVPIERIEQAIRSFVRIREAVEMACDAIKPSEADVQEFVRDTQQKVRIQAVVVNSSKLVDPDWEPSDEAIQAHFAAYRDNDPARGSVTEFGYRLPEKAQTEFIKVKVDALSEAQTVTDEEAYEYWAAHKEEFRQPTTQPSTQPSQPPAQGDPYETFTEARPSVVEKLQEAKAKTEALRIARELITRLARPWKDAPTTQPHGYKEPPAETTGDEVYPELIASLESRYPGVLEYGRTELVDASGAGMAQDIGRARAFPESRRPVPFRNVAFMVAGLENADPEQDPDQARLFRNVYETCAEPLVDGQGTVFVFRTVATRSKQAPETVDEVREDIVRDLRQMRAYEQAEEYARQLAEQAKEEGLKAAFDASDPALKEKLGDQAYQSPEPFARLRTMNWGGMQRVMPNYISGIGGGEELIDLCFSLASPTSTQPTGVAVHEMPRRRQWLVIQGEQTLPVTVAEYEEQRATGLEHIQLERRVAFLSHWFDPEQIRGRIDWVSATPEEPSDEEAGDGEETA